MRDYLRPGDLSSCSMKVLQTAGQIAVHRVAATRFREVRKSSVKSGTAAARQLRPRKNAYKLAKTPEGDIIPRPKSLYVKPGSPPLRRKEDAWKYDLGYIHTIDSDEISNIIENTFRDKVSDISEFVKTYNLRVKLFVVLKIDPEQTPAVGFKPSFVKILGDLYAEIDMDIYVT